MDSTQNWDEKGKSFSRSSRSYFESYFYEQNFDLKSHLESLRGPRARNCRFRQDCTGKSLLIWSLRFELSDWEQGVRKNIKNEISAKNDHNNCSESSGLKIYDFQRRKNVPDFQSRTP